MEDLTGRVVVIGQADLKYLAGSEIVVLELAEHFSARGAAVVIATRTAGEPMRTMAEAVPRVVVRDVDDPELDAELRTASIHLAWIHHHVVPRALLERSDVPVIFAHLSAIHPLEFPLVSSVENARAALSVFVSPETLRRHEETGWITGLEPERRALFRNPVPNGFLDIEPAPPQDRPRLLVVSNHVPDEMEQALGLVAERCEVIRIGRQPHPSSQVRRVTPELIAQATAVVTIGKTVQYALAGSRPVYCYDHFGGPGWLTARNLDETARRNFSGRGFSQLTADEIARDLVAGLEQARREAPELKRALGPEYRLVDAVLHLEGMLSRLPRRPPLDDAAVHEHWMAQEIVTHQVRSARRVLEAVHRERVKSAELRRALDEERRAVESHRISAAEAECTVAARELELDILRDSLAETAATLERMTAKRNDERRAAKALRAELDRTRATVSWRITRPLRWILTKWRRSGESRRRR